MSTTKYIPILFKPEMVNAILEGRKTQTRRAVKPQPDDSGLHDHFRFPLSLQDDIGGWYGTVESTGESKLFNAPCAIGNVLWVRETWSKTTTDKTFVYKADNNKILESLCIGWKSSIHMPKEACRLFLEVTEVRVQRLQDIKENDAIAEGVNLLIDEDGWRVYHHTKNPPDTERWVNPVAAFKYLWQSINGDESWQANPFVWAITFKRIDKPANWPC